MLNHIIYYREQGEMWFGELIYLLLVVEDVHEVAALVCIFNSKICMYYQSCISEHQCAIRLKILDH